MYEYEGLSDIFFIMLYGGATMMAVLAGLYLWLRSGNALNSETESPKGLRRWAAAFLASIAASHVWWALLGTIWLTDDRLIRNIVAITLDRVTFVPLMMCVLLRMLQDRHRPLWPIAVAMVPFFVVAVVAIVIHYDYFEWFVEGYSLQLSLIFIIYYVHALRKYGRWLHDNFADLEHKELWQSLLLLACILLIYVVYTTNEGALAVEYLAQVLTLVIIAFVVWRVETLQILLPEELEGTEETVETEETEESRLSPAPNTTTPQNRISFSLLKKWKSRCMPSTACSIRCACNWISNASRASSSARSTPSSTTCSLAVSNRC